MFTKVIIQFTSRVSFPLIKKPDSFAENKENAKEMKLKTTLCWMLVTLLLLSFAQAEELPAVRVWAMYPVRLRRCGFPANLRWITLPPWG